VLKDKEMAEYKTQLDNEEKLKNEEVYNRLNEELKEINTEHSDIRSQLSSSKTLIDEKIKETDELKAEIDTYKNEIREFREQINLIKSENISLKEKNNNLSENLEKQKQEIQKIGEQFSNEFKVLANNILEEKSKKFTEQNRLNLKTILDPLGENIKEFKKKVEETYDIESKQRFSLETKIKELVELNHKISDEAHNLTLALKGSAKTQGDWGEMILETILENSGLEKGREFFVQEFLRDEAGKTIKDQEGKKLQPDVLIKYPDGRNVIIDSKVSLTAYERYVSEENDENRSAELKNHIRSLKNHIDGLSSKNYDSYTKSLDFVMLFVPIEPAYLLAIKHDTGLWDYAYHKKILLISPTNLIAALKLVADLWKREHQNRNAFEIAERGGRLFDKFVSFAENLEDIGNHIARSQKSYDSAINQLKDGKGNLISQVEKLKELGVKTQKNIPISLKKKD
jgi:DNA recombination protein RmuC